MSELCPSCNHSKLFHDEEACGCRVILSARGTRCPCNLVYPDHDLANALRAEFGYLSIEEQDRIMKSGMDMSELFEKVRKRVIKNKPDCEHSSPTNTNDRICLVNVGEECDIQNCLGYSPVDSKCVHRVQKDTVTVFEYHVFCMEHGISRANFEYEDGEVVEYVKIAANEFQLTRVGDCATKYTVR